MKTKVTVEKIKSLLDKKLQDSGVPFQTDRIKIVLVAPGRDNANWTVWSDWRLDFAHEINKAQAELKMQYDVDTP